MKKIIIFRNLLILAGVILFAQPEFVGAADWYVSTNGNNSSGDSWVNAWDDVDQIIWNSLNPGDTVYLDGGSTSMTYGAITSGKGGTSNDRITITRSTVDGHNGKVYFSGATISHPYITIDGLDKEQMEVFGSGGYTFRIQSSSDGFEMKNIYLWGNSSGSFGVLIYATAGSLTLRNIEISGQSAREDQIKFHSSGDLVIEDSVFHGWESIEGSHSDFLEGCNSGTNPDCPQGNVTIRRNFFYDAPHDCFMMSDSALGDVELSYNIFYGVADAFKFTSANSIKDFNNIFVNCRELIGSASSMECKNNIYIGQSVWNSPVNTCESPENSLWDVGALGFVPGSGNLQADPLFLDGNNLQGVDGELFTMDDGFRLRPGSPAIDAGVEVGLTGDIIGNVISNLPDIGAYEYAEPDPTPPVAPGGLSVR